MTNYCETLEDVKLKYNVSDEQVRLMIRFLPNKQRLCIQQADLDDDAEILRLQNAQIDSAFPPTADVLAAVEQTRNLAIAEVMQRKFKRHQPKDHN